MLKTIKSLALIFILVTIITLPITGCDMFTSNDSYNSEIIIEGIEIGEHSQIFKVINDYDDTILEWDENDFEDGSLRGDLTNLSGNVELELLVDNEEITDDYIILEPGQGKININQDNQAITFEVELDYEPEVTDISIVGPEEIYAASRQGEKNEYNYSAEILDQYNNELDRELNWSLIDTDNDLTLEDNILTVGWDIIPEDFIIKAESLQNDEIYDELSVALNYLEEEKLPEYEDIIEELEDIMTGKDLMEIKGTLELPEEIDEYEIIWDASRHEAIEIVDNQPVISEVEENTEGYLEAFVQPGKEIAPQNIEEDPRKEEFKTRVLKPSSTEINLSMKHNYPASKVDNFFSLKSMSDYDLKVKEVNRAETLSASRIEEAIVTVKEGSDLNNIAEILKDTGYLIKRSNKTMNSLLLEIPANRDFAEVKEEIFNIETVKYVDLNTQAVISSINHPSDENYPYQWHYPQIRLPQAWDINTGSKDIDISVIDTGVDTGHPDIGDNIDEAAGYNFVDDNYDFTDFNTHGTHVAGTIAANSGSEGVSGVMWESNVIPLKALGDDGRGDVYAIADALLYSAGLEGDYSREPLDQPVDIINMSLGTSGYNYYFEDAVNKVLDEGVIVIAAAGNDGEENLIYPAKFEGVISVGATDFNHPNQPELAPYSNYSKDLDILAPGGNIDSDSDRDGYDDGVLSPGIMDGNYEYLFMQGTSMAAPHVSGVAGLMLAEGTNPSKIVDILRNTSMKLDSYQYDAGLINAYWALNQVDEIEINLFKGDETEPISTELVDLKEDKLEFILKEIGEYRLEALIDVRNTGEIDRGDYHVKQYFNVENTHGETIEIDLQLEEKSGDNILN